MTASQRANMAARGLQDNRLVSCINVQRWIEDKSPGAVIILLARLAGPVGSES